MKSYTWILIAELGQLRLIDPEKFDSRFASRSLGALLIGSENPDLSNEMSRPKPLADLLQADFPGENVKEALKKKKKKMECESVRMRALLEQDISGPMAHRFHERLQPIDIEVAA